jgi:cell division septum initiation protein DivIVA
LLKEDKNLLYQLASENVKIKEKIEKMQSQIAELDQEVFTLKSAYSYTYRMWKNKDMYQQAG